MDSNIGMCSDLNKPLLKKRGGGIVKKALQSSQLTFLLDPYLNGTPLSQSLRHGTTRVNHNNGRRQRVKTKLLEAHISTINNYPMSRKKMCAMRPNYGPNAPPLSQALNSEYLLYERILARIRYVKRPYNDILLKSTKNVNRIL